jgi:MipA family protein
MKAAALITGLAVALPAAAVERPLWELGAGAAVLELPHYRGSDQSHTWLLPIPYLVYRGKIFKADREGARAVLFETDRLDFDLSASASTPVRSRDNEARKGMADLPATVEVGPNANLTLARGEQWKLDLRAPVRTAITLDSHARTIGWVATPGLNLDVADVAGWNLGLRAGPIWADRRFNAHYYEVSPADATPDRPAYRARAGYGGAQFIAAASRRFDHYWTGAFIKYDTLQGATFADSPLVRQRQQWSFGVALSWVFSTSSRMVDVPR